MRVLATGLCCFLAGTTATYAKKNVTDFPLEFRPQQVIAGAESTLDPAMVIQACRVRIRDGRGLNDSSTVGRRTDDDDRLYTLRATNDVVGFVEKVFLDTSREWGLAVSEDEGAWTLQPTLTQFNVIETNQAVGATYEAAVTLVAELQDASGAVLWSGSAMGDATRYGKKFSNDNCNEVLSDALLETWAALLSSPSLHDAWRGNGGPSVANDAPEPGVALSKAVSAPLTPAQLLEQVIVLTEAHEDLETVVFFVHGAKLTRSINAEDVAYWRASRVAPEVIRALEGRLSVEP